MRTHMVHAPHMQPWLELRVLYSYLCMQACHRTFYSTLHGAWLSGEAQAELLLGRMLDGG